MHKVGVLEEANQVHRSLLVETIDEKLKQYQTTLSLMQNSEVGALFEM